VLSNKETGFTLIELLIVVAIIAILAMIAVPNFLEAQTRAKVSRVRSDLRSLAVAEEAYQVDWNSYTKYDRGGDDALPGGQFVIEGWKQLTTPVAYITSLPHDPFGGSRYGATSQSSSPPLYELGTGEAGVGPAAPRSGLDTPMTRPANTYFMSSKGPDHLDQTASGTGRIPPGTFNFAEYLYPWVALQANSPAMVAEALTLIYDPTNGTVSWGDIHRFGGQKPGGQVWDVFWAASSR